jgi:hypothetical protein
MTKTLQSNKQSEVDAESVPSSLRIVCDDASSINLQAAETAEEGKPAFEIVFLNGRRTPVIERVEMPANTLGMGFRSYIDFGVNSQDPRAAVKVTGE